MNDTLRQGKRAWTLTAWALLILAPWIQLAVISLVIGKNALTTHPVWTDELDYWRNLFSWVHVGFSQGYNGIGEYSPLAGTLSVRGIAPILLYGGWCKLFGLTHFSIVLCNAVWISAAALVFCALVKPKAGVAALLAGILTAYVPAVLYVTTSMTELFNYALLLFFAAFFFRAEKTKSKWMSVLCWLTVIFACLYRNVYFALFLPLIAAGSSYRFSKKTVGLALLSLVFSTVIYGITRAVTAPSPAGFPYNWLRAENAAAFAQMFFSHAKANLYNYFIRHANNPMEDALRWLYCLAMGWTLVGTFFSLKRTGWRLYLKIGLNRDSLGCFLFLFVPLAAVVTLYETNDWRDFRMLAPFLWGAAVLLAVRKRRALSAVLLAGSVAMLVWLCVLSPVGAFRDEYRFTAPPFSEEVTKACEVIMYDPEAPNPYANTVRTDMTTFQVMREIDPAMGIWTGWFTPDNTGKSRWILTDHLKIAVEGYEAAYTDRGAKVYYRITDYQP